MLAEQASLSALPTFFALATCLILCMCAESVGVRLGVMDSPDNRRKNHARPTPLVGGIAILASTAIWLIGSLLLRDLPPRGLAFAFLLPVLGVGLVGLTDDQSSLSPVARILFLLLFLSIAFVLAPSLISPVLYWGSFAPTTIPAFGFCALMAFASVGVVNAVNMADGQNGIVPGMFVVWSACLVLVGDPNVSALAQILFGVSFIVLIFNVFGKLFLGDCGTYGVTFALGLATMLTHAEGRVSVETIAVWFFIPVVDCLRLIITRLLRGRSPMEADNDHFHHRLQAEFGPRYGLIAYVGVVGLTSLMAAIAPHLALLCLIVLTAFYCSFAALVEPGLESAQAPPGPEPQGSLKIIPLPAPENFRGRRSATTS